MLEQGMFIADRYEVIEKIGTGGMSDVYRAKDLVLGREVAVKVLKSDFSDDTGFVQKFRSEAQSAAGLEHPNIVNIYDVGSDAGMYFIVMEYVEGITLKTYIEKKGQLNFKETISIAIQVGRGIEAAHQKGIIHRDIKPHNIMISTEGKVKVTDFGIARAASSNTIHADVMGSVHYSSPEQTRNGYVDGKSDIYSLGIVMYEMVTGRVPFDGDSTVAIALKHLQEDMVNPSVFAPELPISLEKIILKATMKSPDRRYATISDMLLDLKKALVNPNDDFVVISDMNIEKTRMVSLEEQAIVNKKAAEVLMDDKAAMRKSHVAMMSTDEEEDEYDEEYDEDDEMNPNMDKAITIMGIAAAVVIIAIIIVILGNILGLFHFGAKNAVKMIDVEGITYDVALEKLEKLGLDEDVDIKIIYEDIEDESEYEDGEIIEQSVKKGDKFKLKDKKSVLELTVARLVSDEDIDDEDSEEEEGGELVSVPSVTGNDEESAIKALEDVGLKYTREYKADSSVKAGKVISQSPEAGSDLATGKKVALVISSGSQTTKVPNVTGKSKDEAIKLLNDAGLNVTSTDTESSDSVPAGNVISQSIAAKKEVDQGTDITLVISSGAKTTYYSYSETITAGSDTFEDVPVEGGEEGATEKKQTGVGAVYVTLIGNDGDHTVLFDGKVEADKATTISVSNCKFSSAVLTIYSSNLDGSKGAQKEQRTVNFSPQ